MGFQEDYDKIIKKLDKLHGDQIMLRSELNSAYDYKEDIIGKMTFADKQIAEKQTQYYMMLGEAQTEIATLKELMDLEVLRLKE